MTTFEQIPSVKTAVTLEAQRRKRVFLMFLALLAVPVAIGVYAIAKAPDDAQVMAARVTPIVEETLVQKIDQRVDQTIEPRVEALVAQRATPVIERTLERAVAARVEPLERNYRALTVRGDTENEKTAVRIRELEARVAALERRLAALSGARVPNPREEIKDRAVITYTPKKP